MEFNLLSTKNVHKYCCYEIESYIFMEKPRMLEIPGS